MVMFIFGPEQSPEELVPQVTGNYIGEEKCVFTCRWERQDVP